MKKEDFEIYAIDYLKGNLKPSESQAFERLLVDEGLNNELNELKALINTSCSWENEDPPTGLREKFFESLSGHEQSKTDSKRSLLAKIDEFIGTIGQYQHLKRLAFSLVLVLCGGLIGYSLNGPNKGAKVLELTEQIQEMQVNIAKIQLRSYSPSDRMKGVSYASMQTSHSGRLMEDLFFSLVNDESVHIRIATAQVLHKFQDRPEVRLALEKALIREQDNLGKLNLISLVETFNPDLAKQERQKLLNETLNPQLRKALEQNQS